MLPVSELFLCLDQYFCFHVFFSLYNNKLKGNFIDASWLLFFPLQERRCMHTHTQSFCISFLFKVICSEDNITKLSCISSYSESIKRQQAHGKADVAKGLLCTEKDAATLASPSHSHYVHRWKALQKPGQCMRNHSQITSFMKWRLWD